VSCRALDALGGWHGQRQRIPFKQRGAAMIAVALILGLGASIAAATVRPSRNGVTSTKPGRILWGAWIGNAYNSSAAPWDISTLDVFTRSVKHAPSIVSFYQDFETCSPNCTDSSFPVRQMTQIRTAGAIPMLSWASMADDAGVDSSRLSLTSIASGALDSYLRSFARAAKRWGHPFFLRFDWEMNSTGSGFPWVVGIDGNTASEYVAAWRHVHDIFQSVGARNVTWVWCPDATDNAQTQASAAEYPGDAYVNWTGLDAYNWGTARPPSWGGWQSFTRIVQKSYRRLRAIAPAKPIMIGELGTTGAGGDKASWVTQTLRTIPKSFPAIRAVVYFDDYEGDLDWPLNSTPASLSAFRDGISASAYASNRFGRLRGGIVAPAG
jgi:hypothetical protein